MIPSSLFYDFVDAQVAFKVVQRNLNSPNLVFSVPRAKDGQLRLTMLGSQALVGSPDAVLARLNALLCEDSKRQPQKFSLRQATAGGKLISYLILPEADRGKQMGMPEEISGECRIMPADYPNGERETAVVSALVAQKRSFHLMEMVGKDSFQEIGRLSPHALPREIHEKLAANGFYEESFVSLYGEEAFEEARLKLKETWNNWTAANLDVRHAPH
ncbi:hypothetical protein [Rhizobium mesoamericanum]|uniref:Uncharacterized protein n=1 Tax=Rhizobium mesoamericanum STM3625 TaxID=1211777 RepID=K0PL37_9HYPH|nr:hypothetical protein [Rhizobium mesoamericanum]CCM77141.1 hypothetical protein BN77_4192 [Rhizobium mesoamericanum STM3625]